MASALKFGVQEHLHNALGQVGAGDARAQGQRQQEELSSYLEEQYQQAAQQDGEAYVQSLLAAAGLQAKEIQVSTDRNQDGSIVLTEVAAVFTYPVEGERASALLRNALGEGVRVTVETGG